MQRLIDWCKTNWQILVVAFFLAFIPLYPKLPLFDIVQTWVYIRLEDILVGVAVAVWLIAKIRARAPPKGTLVGPIAWYWGVGLLVLAASILFIGPKIPEFYPHLALLHYLRRIEYMVLFFVAYDITRRHKEALPVLLWVLSFTILGVVIYGIGQKFFGFPAYLTMNEEFAKGVPLRLPPTARIASTFGGHYDLGAYLVFVIPVLGSMVFGMRRWWQKIIFAVLAVLALILLLFTASRISFGVYLIAVSAMLLWHKKALLIIPVIALSMLLLNSVSGASERFYKTFRYEDVIIDLSTGQPIGTADMLDGGRIAMEQQERPDEESLPKGSGFVSVPTGETQAYQTIEVYTSTDLATGSGEIATISGSFLVQKALVYDISITTRFQGQWPKAIAAFKRNILLGSGFSTLSVAADGDYLRMLGETGIVGTIAFLGILLMAFAVFFRKAKLLEPLPFAFAVGVFAGIVGLMLNAILIDVFEASKVAFTLWLMLGVVMAILDSARGPAPGYFRLLRSVLTNRISWGVYLTVLVFVLYGRAIGMYFMGDDFTWLRWAAETTPGDILRYFTSSQGFFYRPIPKLWYFVLYSVFWLKPAAYHIASLAIFSGMTLLLLDILRSLRVRFVIAIAASVLFAVLSVHHESIYWISTHSHLLSALFFFAALAIALRVWQGRVAYAKIAILSIYVLLFFSGLSHEGMLVAPLLLWVIGVFLFGQRRSRALHGTLLLMPVMWLMRTLAGAVGAEGDYGYNPATLPINAVSNTAAYLGAILGGPRVIEWFAFLRGQLRALRLPLGLSAVVGIPMFFVAIRRSRQLLIWVVLLGIALLPYLGLGATSERYALVASGIVCLGLGVLAEALLARKPAFVTAALLSMAVVILIGWNVSESRRVGEDWQKASDVSRDTLLAVKTGYFPLTYPMSFRFYNTPIRYGRAWIFPTGLNDALWHMFKFNQFPYETVPVNSPAEAFTYPLHQDWASAPLGFEDYKLKKLIKVLQPVEE